MKNNFWKPCLVHPEFYKGHGMFAITSFSSSINFIMKTAMKNYLNFFIYGDTRDIICFFNVVKFRIRTTHSLLQLVILYWTFFTFVLLPHELGWCVATNCCNFVPANSCHWSFSTQFCMLTKCQKGKTSAFQSKWRTSFYSEKNDS